MTGALSSGGYAEGTVRFVQPEVKGARPSKLMGKGTVSLEETSLVFTGKRLLPFWARLLVVVGAAAASLALLGIVAWPIAIAVLLFGRVRHRESWPAASVQSVAYEPGRHRFLVTARVGAEMHAVAWQSQPGSGPLAEAFRQRFPDSFREDAVRGWKTF